MPEAHATLGGVSLFHDYDWAKAEEEFKTAIELNPSYATAHQWYHLLLSCQERVGYEYDELKKALDLDPLSLIINNNLAGYFRIRKEYDMAERQARSILEMHPDSTGAHWTLMFTYLRTSRPEQASQEAVIISSLSKDPTEGRSAFAYLLAMTGKVVEAKSLVSELEKAKANGEYVHSIDLAELRIMIGDVDNGFEWLERAYEERDGHLFFLRVTDGFDAVRSDPRYLSLLKKIGLS